MFDSLPGVSLGGACVPFGADVAGTLAVLADTPSSAGAVALLAATDPGRLSFDERLDALRAWERAAAWVAAQTLQVVAALADGDQVRDSVLADWTREELACALRISGVEAARRIGLAADLRSRLAGTAAALLAGDLSPAKAEAIARGAQALSGEHAAAVEAMVLPDAPDQTLAELRRAVWRAVLTVDAEGAAERADAARERRGLRCFPQPDGMAGIWADLPAADAQTVMTGLDDEADRIAADLRQAGQPVPGQSARRADALVRWAYRALAAPGGPTVHGRRPTVHVTVPASTLLGVDHRPGELAGYGPIDADTARRIAATGIWRRLLTDPVTGRLLDHGRGTYTPPADLREFVIVRDGVCTFPGCDRPARRCHLDHRLEWQHGGTTCHGNLHPLCGRHHTCKSTGLWQPAYDETTGVTTWTSPTGRTYQSRPPPLDHPTRPPPEPTRTAEPTPGPDDPPPF